MARLIAQNNQDLLGQFKTLVTDSISELKRSHEDTAAQQMKEIKRIKRDPTPQFNKKSNEDQFKVNKAIKETIDDVKTALKRKDLEKTKEALDKGMSLVQERQTFILLADKSPFGWKTVNEYNIMTCPMTTKTKRKFIEPKQGQPGLLSALPRVYPINEEPCRRPFRPKLHRSQDNNSLIAFLASINTFQCKSAKNRFWRLLCVRKTRTLAVLLPQSTEH